MARRKRTVLKKAAGMAGILLLVLIAGFVVYVLRCSVEHPPAVEDLSVLQANRMQYGDTYVIGNNWLRKSESGLWECYLEGDAFERGAVFGMLTRELLYYQESVFVEQIRQLVPSDLYLKVLKYFISFFNRNLEDDITDEYRKEIYGTSFACDPSFDFIGTGYQRQLNYHAAHDIGHALHDFNMVGCTSFSVWDDKSKDSSLIVGRNFDFYMGKGFAENKIVCFINPDQGYKFMMVTWADMIGVVSGMNEKGLTVTLNAARSAIPTGSSTPISLLAREILQYAGNIDEACEIAAKRTLFVSESIMVSSAADGRTVIIEKSPKLMDVVNPVSDQIICTNHFQGALFADDSRNIENINGSDSYLRYLRVQELLENDGAIDVQKAAGILRDQKGLHNVNLGMGNQLAINQLIAHHSVIFKPDSLLTWVSTSPWQLGKFVAYDLQKVFSTDTGQIIQNREICLADRTIPADTFLYNEDYQHYETYLEMSEQLSVFRKNKEVLPGQFSDRLVQLNPDYYGTYVQLGDYYRRMKDYGKAREYYEEALTKEISGQDRTAEILALAEKIKNKRR